MAEGKLYIAMRLEYNDSWDLENDFTDIPSQELTIKVPVGCVGIQLVFESHESAVRVYGEDTETVEMFIA